MNFTNNRCRKVWGQDYAVHLAVCSPCSDVWERSARWTE